MQRTLAVVYVCGSLSISTVGCSEARTTACSTGTPQSRETVVPREAFESSAPDCVRRCGDTTQGQWGGGGVAPTISALPTGRCEHPGEQCQMKAVVPCEYFAPVVKGQLHLAECTCEAGSWVCRTTYFGGGACTPPPPGRDAGMGGTTGAQDAGDKD